MTKSFMMRLWAALLAEHVWRGDDAADFIFGT